MLIRWFQFGALCPIFRLHGFRHCPGLPLGGEMTGGPNEVWSYGDQAYPHPRQLPPPYANASAPTSTSRCAPRPREGLPPMRALFLEFPDDDACWTVADSYLLGPDLLVAPVTTAGATTRPEVYLPAGARWTCAWTGADFEGGAPG